MKNTTRNNGHVASETGTTERSRERAPGNSRIAPFLIGAVAGGIVGAAIAFLYAPVEGAEIRREAKEKFDDITESINSILKNAKTSAEKMLSEGRGDVDEIIDRTRERADDLLEDADRAIEEARRRSANLGFTEEEGEK
jgi:gas vesicle protein